MSFQSMSWAVSQKCGSAAAKMVLMMLANHANGHTNRCNPRHKTLADECEMRVETLKNHLKHLSEIGLITIIPQFAEGIQLPNHYALNVEGGGGEKHPGGGGEKHPGGGGEKHPPINQEYKQEDNQEAAHEILKKKSRASKPEVTFADWAANLATSGEQAIPADDPIYAYAEQIGLTDDLLGLAWFDFGQRYRNNPKKYKDWREVYRKSVREDWLKLWRAVDDGYVLTTKGQQVQRLRDAKRGMAA